MLETLMKRIKPKKEVASTRPDTEQDPAETTLGPEYTVDGQRAQEFLGLAESIPKNEFDAWGGVIRHWPTRMKRDGYVLQLGNVLGEGGFGTVMEATREPDMAAPEELRTIQVKDVVVKYIILNCDNKQYARRLQSVYRELAALSQNNMLYDAYLLRTEGVSDTVVVAIEIKKLEGPSISKYIEALEEDPNRYTAEKRLEMMKMFRHCLVQLRVLAKRGWQHRDIKPANILVNNGNTRITDFGIARRVDDSTGKQRSTGTPMYMTPRTVETKKDPFADLYALGIIVGEEMGYLSGKQFDGVVQVMLAISRGELWSKTSSPESLTMNTQAEQQFTQLIDEIVQCGAGKNDYHNPFGTDEFSKENIVESITKVLRRAHGIINQQERELAANQQQRRAA